MVDRKTRMRVAYKMLRDARKDGNQMSIALADAYWLDAQKNDKEYLESILACDCPELDAMRMDEDGLDRLLDDLGIE